MLKLVLVNIKKKRKKGFIRNKIKIIEGCALPLFIKIS